MKNPGSVEVIYSSPYTCNITHSGEVVLSSPSNMSVVATNVLLRDHPEAMVVIAGEHTFGSSNPSTGELMAKELTAAEDKVVLLEHEFPGINLNNTALQIEAFNLWLQRLSELPNIVTLSHAFHLPRTSLHMPVYGIPSWHEDIGEVIVRAGLADSHPEMKYLSAFEVRERIVRALAGLDRKGTVTKKVTERFGPHVHDILVDDCSGEVTIVNTTAKKRLAEIGLVLGTA